MNPVYNNRLSVNIPQHQRVDDAEPKSTFKTYTSPIRFKEVFRKKEIHHPQSRPTMSLFPHVMAMI
jgi:hypothetical protein